MNHSEIDTGTLRAYIDGEVEAGRASALTDHLGTCADCQAQLKVLKSHAASVRAGLDALPQPATSDGAPAWSAIHLRLGPTALSSPPRWSPLRMWSLAAAGVVAIAAVLVFTVAPVRGWAESLLSIFRVERVTVVEINPDSMKGLENDQAFNQQMMRIISDEVTVTQPPQQPQVVAGAATAAKLAGFTPHLIADQSGPVQFLVRSAITAQMKLDRDRLQSMLEEAGRNDIQIPQSIDGAIIGIRVPAGIIASYGNCGHADANDTGALAQAEDASCVKLSETPSPTASVPQEIDPAEIARVALQFAGLSPTEAASFTQTVDWTSTFVLPILHGQSSYEKVNVGGNDAVLLRWRSVPPSKTFALIWVDNGILYSLNGTGDDTTALNLASQIE